MTIAHKQVGNRLGHFHLVGALTKIVQGLVEEVLQPSLALTSTSVHYAILPSTSKLKFDVIYLMVCCHNKALFECRNHL